MAKRFTDTGKWDKAWFRKLSPRMKCAWIFLCDRCDHAGVWEFDQDAFSYFIGEGVTIDDLKSELEDKVELVSNDKLFIKSFIDFQYGALNPSNRVHQSVITRLNKLSPLLTINKPLISPLQGAKDKDKEKDKDKDKEKDKEKEKGKPSPISFLFAKNPEIQDWLNAGVHETHSMLLSKYSNHVLVDLVEKAFAWAMPRGIRAESWLYTFVSNKNTAGFGSNQGQASFKSKSHGVEATPENPTGNPYTAQRLAKEREA